MQECFLFQSGQDHSDSLAIIESGASKNYASNIMKGRSAAAKWLMGDINEKLTGSERGVRGRRLIERLSLAQGYF
jgi:hypothetical protein